MQTIYRYIFAMLALLAGTVIVHAQKATLERVEPAPMDVSAAKYKRADLTGATCALVKVQVLADGVEFTGNIVGTPEHRTGEYWVYLSPGTKMMGIQSSSFLPLMVTFPQFDIPELQPACTYIVTIDLPQAPAQPAPASASFNYLVLKVSPATSKVVVDGKECEVTDGVAKVVLRNGTYAYHVEAPGFLPEDGQVTVSNAKTERTVTLRSTRGSLSVSSATPATEIYINGERKGAGSWRGDLLPNTYIVEGRLDGHRPVEEVVTVGTGETATVKLPPLIPITGSLNVDYLPAGASITIDGTRRGTTPDIIPDLLIGTHTVTISADGHDTATLSATVTEGQLNTITGQLQPATEEKLIRFKSDNDDKWGFKDQLGNIVISAKYDYVHNFSEGLAAVRVDNDSIKNKWGFIDMNDHMVIPAKYTYASDFSEGLAVVEINDKYGHIDKNDRFIIPAIYDYSERFNDGLAIVTLNKKFGYIDRDNHLVIPNKYNYIGHFSENLATVLVNGKWGYINKNGQIVIPPRYEDNWAFSEGLACVKTNGKIGFIDKKGHMVIPAKYNSANSFSEGLAVVALDGKHGYIDKKGSIVIPCIYDYAYDFQGGLAKVWLNNMEFYIDKQGNEVK